MNFKELHLAMKDDDSITLTIAKSGGMISIMTKLNELPAVAVCDEPENLDREYTPYVVQGLQISQIVKADKAKWDQVKKAESDKLKEKYTSSSSSSSSSNTVKTKVQKLWDEANKLLKAKSHSAAFTVLKTILKESPNDSEAKKKLAECEAAMGIGTMFPKEPEPLSQEVLKIVEDKEECEVDSCSTSEEECSECGYMYEIDEESGLCKTCYEKLNG